MSHAHLPAANLFETHSYIDGQWCHGESSFPLYNPATGKLLCELSRINSRQVAHCINVADVAQKKWCEASSAHRASILYKWYELIIECKDKLAHLLCLEQGKPITEALAEINYGASYVKWYSEEARRINGELIPSPNGHDQMMVNKQAIGLVAAITPWNFPNAMITRKVAPALAAGCSVILKPSELTPLSALALAGLSQQAGLPAGLFNVVIHDEPQAACELLLAEPRIRKLSFTGSTSVGQYLMAKSAPTLKRLSLELGGNAPFIVFADANIDDAVDSAMIAKFRNAGQTCIAANRFIIADEVVEEFKTKLKEKMLELQVGDGSKSDTHLGPLINNKAKKKADKLISQALTLGASVESLCKNLKQKNNNNEVLVDNNNYCLPTIVDGITLDMDIWQQEIFAPIVSIISFKTETQALTMANDTKSGLAAYLFTTDMDRVFRFNNELEFGMVAINTGVLSNEMAPFGGIKHSGFGREGSHHGINDYLQLKYAYLKLNK